LRIPKLVRFYHDMGLNPRQIAERARESAPRLGITESLAVARAGFVDPTSSSTSTLLEYANPMGETAAAGAVSLSRRYPTRRVRA
jgi:hypothetical protein